MARNILIVCGEPSGDLNAALLARSLKNLELGIKISAVGGPILKETGAEIFFDIKELSVMGLFDVLKKLPLFFSLKKIILEKIRQEKFDCVIFVDFSGFNLRLAKAINKSIPSIYYISPQIWASREGRVKTIKKYIDKIIVIFGFEKEFYKKYGIEAEFVGHPLLEIASATIKKEELFEKYGLDKSKTTFALLPGSRESEIKNILPVMLKTAFLISLEIKNAQFIIAKPAQLRMDIYERLIADSKINVTVIENQAYDCLNAANFALVASGTATLETAIIGTPFILVYKMNLLNYLLYRPQVKLPYIGMVNIVAGKRIVPEFVQFNAKPKNIAKETLGLLNNPSQLKAMRSNLSKIKSSLGEKGAPLRAAKIIIGFLNSAIDKTLPF